MLGDFFFFLQGSGEESYSVHLVWISPGMQSLDKDGKNDKKSISQINSKEH